ncbi:MAG: hypothetical protein IJV21_03165 [Lachnospiraceae bacterium]|nr:hypothetical protein [Lachnospiraceae bacterium]MBR1671078.1 hypothetical protein [Butyrivibrio sp.]
MTTGKDLNNKIVDEELENVSGGRIPKPYSPDKGGDNGPKLGIMGAGDTPRSTGKNMAGSDILPGNDGVLRR